jgi:hypothetical protein
MRVFRIKHVYRSYKPMELSFYGEEIISKQKFEAFRNYKYAGSDLSILYKYFYSPMADFMVEKLIPPWLA